MNRYFDNHFRREVVTIYPGEFYATKGDEMISTVLGSCVSVALYDRENHVGGINHFMLARDSSLNQVARESGRLLGRFGEYAIDLLIDDIKSKGGILSNLEAKVFGGGNIFNMADIDSQVGNVNSKFAFEYLEKIHIPVVKSNTGGILPRKIFFDPDTQKVFMKFIDKHHVHDTNGNASPTEKSDAYLAVLEKQERELETKISTGKIELKAVKNLFGD